MRANESPASRGTFVLRPNTLKRLKQFSRKSGISQSALVDRILQKGLRHLEEHWIDPDDLLDQALQGAESPGDG